MVRVGDGARSLSELGASVEHALLSDPPEGKGAGTFIHQSVLLVVDGRAGAGCEFPGTSGLCGSHPAGQTKPPAKTAGAGSGVHRASSGSPNPDVDKHEPTGFPKETSGIGSTPLIDLLLCARDFYIYSTLFLLIDNLVFPS